MGVVCTRVSGGVWLVQNAAGWHLAVQQGWVDGSCVSSPRDEPRHLCTEAAEPPERGTAAVSRQPELCIT